MSQTLQLLALTLYGGSAALALAPFAGARSVPRALLLGVPGLGALLHVWVVARLSLVGLSPALSLIALCLILLQLASEGMLRASAVALFTAPLAAGFVGLALLLAPAAAAPVVAARNAWLVAHVSLSGLGVALLTVAGAAAALYLVQFRQLKTKRFGQVFQFFPPLDQLDRLNRTALVVGFVTLTFGALLAVGYEVRFAGAAPVNPPMVVWGMFTWGVLGWAVWARIVRRWSGRPAAVASLTGLAAVVLVYLALKLAAPGAERFL